MKHLLSSALFVTLLTLASNALSSSTYFCSGDSCEISIDFEYGGNISLNNAIISFGEDAGIFFGENGSYDLGLSGYIYGSETGILNASTEIPSGTKLYLGTGASLVFSNGGYLHLGNGGNIENLENTGTLINGATSIENNDESTLIFELESNKNTNYVLQALNSIKFDSQYSNSFKVHSDSITIKSYDIEVNSLETLNTSSLTLMIINENLINLPDSTSNDHLTISSEELSELEFSSEPLIISSNEGCIVNEIPCSAYSYGNDTSLIIDDINTSEKVSIHCPSTSNYSEATAAYAEILSTYANLASEIASTEHPTKEQLDALSEAQSGIDNFTYGYSDNEQGEYIYIFENGEVLNHNCLNEDFESSSDSDKNTNQAGSLRITLLFIISLILCIRRSTR